MPPTPTRTLNPLPFQDLEPHRFEDLVRQLAYDFREWVTLEAIGRSGSDDGMDIRGIEHVRSAASDEEDDASREIQASNVWIFQCKREKVMPPARVKAAILESLPTGSPSPHGFVLAVACDLSKKSRDAFREEMVSRGIREFAVWARGELEDLLFQAKNDRLLFAYFGLSLQPRQRSVATSIRSRVALKKQLKSLLGDDDDASEKYILLRDFSDESYPGERRKNESATPRWALYRFLHMRTPGAICVLHREHLAWVTSSGWDAILEHDMASVSAYQAILGNGSWLSPRREKPEAYHEFWTEYVPESERAHLQIMRYVPLDCILAIDPMGDGFYPVPHLFFDGTGGALPFNQTEWRGFMRPGMMGGWFEARPEENLRQRLFPEPFPLAIHPPPAGFDYSPPDKTESLSEDTVRSLGGILKAIRPVSAPPADQEPETPSMLSNEWTEAFDAWTRDVALPVFDAFVRELRGAGQGARIAMIPERGAKRAIELRVAVALGRHYGDYRAPGHYRISTYGRGHDVILDVKPQEQARSNYRASPAIKAALADFTKQRLERDVISMLERVRASGLERLTEPGHAHLERDQGTAQRQEGFVDIGSAFVA